MHNEDSEVALFVKDLKRGRRLDFEPTIQHYENLLREKNVTNYRITVIPVNQLYNEYATFELRRKLSYLYDKFLVDTPIAAHVNGFLGSKMLKKGRLAIPVNLSKENLSDEIDKAMRKVFYKHVNQGITQNIQVGKHSMPNDQIADNIIDLLRQFGDIHPGGYKNVHKLFLRPQANVSVVIPLYVSAGKCFFLTKKKKKFSNIRQTILFLIFFPINSRSCCFQLSKITFIEFYSMRIHTHTHIQIVIEIKSRTGLEQCKEYIGHVILSNARHLKLYHLLSWLQVDVIAE